MGISPRVFVRDATGLVREIGPLGAFALASGNLSVATGWYLLEFFGSAVPGGELGIDLVIGTILVLFPAIVYGMLSAAFPRSGGDYVFVSRVLDPSLGFMVNFYLAFYWMTSIGFIAMIVIIPNLSTIFAIYGSVYNNPGLLGWVTALSNLNISTIVGVALCFLFTGLALLNVRSFYRLMIVMLALSYMALVLSFGVMWTANPANFAAAFNGVSGTANLYQTIINNATPMGLASTWTWSATLGPGLLYAWLMLGGWQYPAFVAGEVKRPQRILPLTIILSLVLNGLLYALFYESNYHAFGYAFTNAIGFSGVNPGATPLVTPYFVSVLVANNPVLLFLINVGYFMGGPLLILTFYAFGTRCIFAWAFDRVVPAKLSEVSERFGSPVYATLLAGLVYGIFFLLLYNYTTLATYFANMIMGYVIVTMIVMVAAIIFPYKKKDMFENAPEFTKKKIAGVPLMAICGLIGFSYLALVLYGALTNPAIGGPISYASIGFMVGVLVFALVGYYVSVAYHKSKGVDITL